MRHMMIIGLAALASTAAIAQPAPKADRAPMTRADLEAKAAERFAAIDSNRDGAVTKDEMAAHHAARMAKRAERREDRADKAFARRDANSDGRLTREEFAARIATRFERLDINKDGAISVEERKAAREAWGKRRG